MQGGYLTGCHVCVRIGGMATKNQLLAASFLESEDTLTERVTIYLEAIGEATDAVTVTGVVDEVRRHYAEAERP